MLFVLTVLDLFAARYELALYQSHNDERIGCARYGYLE